MINIITPIATKAEYCDVYSLSSLKTEALQNYARCWLGDLIGDFAPEPILLSEFAYNGTRNRVATSA